MMVVGKWQHSIEALTQWSVRLADPKRRPSANSVTRVALREIDASGAKFVADESPGEPHAAEERHRRHRLGVRTKGWKRRDQ
jgi:hypothetical protein